jgi:ABC-type multidrug transport system ATPase subunit
VSDEPVLEFAHVSKSYDDVVALDDVTFAVMPGTLVALVGHNGAGKSTLMRLAAGLDAPTLGTVFVEDYKAGTMGARGALTYASDTPILYDDLSVWEHLEYVGGLHGVEDWETPGADMLEKFDLTDRADDLPVRFSRGMRQKAALAVALVRPATVALIDEPFVGLDVRAQERLAEILVELAAEGCAVVVATHQPAFLSRVDRCVVLHDGQVQYDGAPGDEVLEYLRED